jgi:hypothetical protein
LNPRHRCQTAAFHHAEQRPTYSYFRPPSPRSNTRRPDQDGSTILTCRLRQLAGEPRGHNPPYEPRVGAGVWYACVSSMKLMRAGAIASGRALFVFPLRRALQLKPRPEAIPAESPVFSREYWIPSLLHPRPLAVSARCSWTWFPKVGRRTPNSRLDDTMAALWIRTLHRLESSSDLNARDENDGPESLPDRFG